MVASGVFHTNANGTPPTTESTIHMAAGITVFLTMVIAMYVFAWRFRRDPRWRGFATPTLFWALAGTVTFFLIPFAGDPRFGLAQRLHIATWLSWLLLTAIRTRRLATSTRQMPERTPTPALAQDQAAT
jgi:FtsH-binding integral membrane protein